MGKRGRDILIKGMREWGRKNKGSHIDRAREKQTQRSEMTHTHTHVYISAFCVRTCQAGNNAGQAEAGSVLGIRQPCGRMLWTSN